MASSALKMIFLILLALLLLGCGDFHEVTFLVESDGTVDFARMAWGHDNSFSWYGAPVLLPATAVEHFRHVEAVLMANTDTDTSGTITATILLDGVPIATDSVTASGSPAELTVTAYIPD